MDILNIDRQLELLKTIGYCLTIDERMRLKMAHAQVLQAHPHIDQLKFWGRIEGIQKNYYVLLGLQYQKCFQFPHKSFFWATNDLQFKEMPDLLLQHKGMSDQFKSALFFGDPNKVLVSLEGEAQEGGQEGGQPEETGEAKEAPKDTIEEDQDVKKEPKKNFTELMRLTHVVRAIENDVHCVPKNSYRLTPQHELHPTKNFTGLDEANALYFSSWIHFRSPQTAEAKAAVEEDMAIFNPNISESIDRDEPVGCWSVQLDSKRVVASLRSLKWPGYFALHQLKTSNFGSVYLGEGVKNTDLAFML